MTDSMDPRAAAWAELHHPATAGARLAEIAQAHPEFAAAIGRHPQAYPELVAWADRATRTAVAGQQAVVRTSRTVAGPQVVGPTAGPGSALRKAAWILTLVCYLLPSLPWTPMGNIAGPTVFNGINVLYLVTAVLTAAGAITGSALAPTIARRAPALALCVFAAAIELGPLLPFVTPALEAWTRLDLWALQPLLLFTAWVLSWPLPGRSFLAAVLLGVDLVLRYLSFFGGSPIPYQATWILSIAIPLVAVLVASLLGLGARRGRTTLAVQSHRFAGSEMAPAGAPSASPGVPYATPGTVPPTNILAILSLVFSFFVSLVAVILGHVALGQIRRTGEQGRGLAIAGLILGYLGLVAGALIVIWWIVILVQFGQLASTTSGYYD